MRTSVAGRLLMPQRLTVVLERPPTLVRRGGRMLEREPRCTESPRMCSACWNYRRCASLALSSTERDPDDGRACSLKATAVYAVVAMV